MKTVFSMSKSSAIKCIAACALAFTAGISSAAVTLFSGDTTGDPTWNRPLSGFPPTNLSGVGTAVRYEVIEFQVNNSATYDFRLTSTFDNYLFLYQSSFNPTSQLTNVIVGNDDFSGTLNAGFNSIALTAGAQYYLVATGFANTDFGSFNGSITGAGGDDIATIGSVSPIPEPAEWAMMLAGLGAVSWAAKRRKS
jgi:hypothetical protein